MRARIVLQTIRVVCYLCPIWLFGPLLYFTVIGADRKGEARSSTMEILSELTGPTERVVMDTVTRDETLSDIFLTNGVSYAELLEVLKVSRRYFNLNRLRSGSVVKLVFDGEERLSRLEYEIDDKQLLLVNVHQPDSMSVRVDEVDFHYRQRLVSGGISSSLYQTIQEMGESMEIAFLLSEIYAWQIDFSTDLRGGDSFNVILEEYWGRDGVIRLNAVIASEFFNDGKLYQAFRFEDPEGHVDYYDGTGASLRRKFLKSPLKYTRISSRFSRRRFHPILKVYRPHLGVDYAAPSGTPVVTVGDGEIVFAGWQRGFGNIVKVRHNGVYQTMYGHLKGFARGVRKGAKAKQGQVVGYVGTTGQSTGPHLDFRLIRRGNYVNPLKVDLPAADPVKKMFSADFHERVVDYMEFLEAGKSMILASRTERERLEDLINAIE